MARSIKYFLHKNICSQEQVNDVQRTEIFTLRHWLTSARRLDRLTSFSSSPTTSQSPPYTSLRLMGVLIVVIVMAVVDIPVSAVCWCHTAGEPLMLQLRLLSVEAMQRRSKFALVAASLIYVCNEKVARPQRVFKYTVWQVAHLVTAITTTTKRKRRRAGKQWKSPTTQRQQQYCMSGNTTTAITTAQVIKIPN